MQFAEMRECVNNLGALNMSIDSEGLLLLELDIGAATSQKSRTWSHTFEWTAGSGRFVDQTSHPQAALPIVS